MMNGDRTLVPAGSPADAATEAVPLQNYLSQSAEMLLILPPKRVAGRTHSIGKLWRPHPQCIDLWVPRFIGSAPSS